MTYCDYRRDVRISKPNMEIFEKAMVESGVKDKSKCVFVDTVLGPFPF